MSELKIATPVGLSHSGRLGFLRCRLHRAGHHTLDEALHVLLRDAALGATALYFTQRHAEFAREAADRWRGVGQRTLRRGGLVRRRGRNFRSP